MGPTLPPVAGKRAEALLDTMLFIEMFTLTRAWTGLTDDEFLWEPLDGSWSVRPKAECRTPTPFGRGEWLVDFDGDLAMSSTREMPAEPLTTIAWLMWHVGSMPGRAAELDFLGGTRAAGSGWTSPYSTDHPIFISAAEAVETMQHGWRALDQALQAATDEQLEHQTRFWGYGGQPGPAAPGHQILASTLNEISHHGTQICVLRDLYRVVGGRRLGEAAVSG